MKLLITGGSGFIGSNFINRWLTKNSADTIVNLDLMTYCANPLTVEKHKEKFGKRYIFKKGDIADEKTVHEAMKDIDIIVHFAAESHVDRSIENPGNFLRTNIIGTFVLLEEARKKGGIRFHHISTDEVFGALELDNEKFDEMTRYDPRSPYSASKASADHFVNAYFRTYNMPITITNCSNNYGPYQFPEKVIPLYITRLMQNLPIPIYGKGIAVRDYLYVEDHCEAIEEVILKGKIGESYCIGGNSERNTKEVAKTILKNLSISDKEDILVKYTKDRTGHDLRYSIDYSKIKKDLGWKPKVSFDDGIKKTIEWYKKNKEWWLPIYEKAEEVAKKYLSSI